MSYWYNNRRYGSTYNTSYYRPYRITRHRNNYYRGRQNYNNHYGGYQNPRNHYGHSNRYYGVRRYNYLNRRNNHYHH